MSSELHWMKLGDLLVKKLSKENHFRNKDNDLLVNVGDVYTFDEKKFYLIIEIDSNVIHDVLLNNPNTHEG